MRHLPTSFSLLKGKKDTYESKQPVRGLKMTSQEERDRVEVPSSQREQEKEGRQR